MGKTVIHAGTFNSGVASLWKHLSVTAGSLRFRFANFSSDLFSWSEWVGGISEQLPSIQIQTTGDNEKTRRQKTKEV